MPDCVENANGAPNARWRHLSIQLLLLLAALLPPAGSARADHIRGQFVAEQGHVLRVSQRGLSVQGTLMVANGQQLSLIGLSDGNDFVSGTLSGAQFSGTFEMAFQHGQPSTVRIVVYNGQTGAVIEDVVFRESSRLPPRRQPDPVQPTPATPVKPTPSLPYGNNEPPAKPESRLPY
ncbi:MAG: hypothetical protein R3E68_13550 [Burkholderiaceae bacterium]